MTALKTAVFIAGAALFHVLVTLIVFSALLFLYVPMIIPRIPAASVFWGFPLLFSAAFVLSSVLYRKAVSFSKSAEAFPKLWFLGKQP
jgi:hypothetical protein